MSAIPERHVRLAILFVAHAMGTANISLVLAFSPTLQDQLALTTASFGLAVTCYYAAQAASALPAGWIADRFGIRATLVAAHVMLALGMARIATAQGWTSLAIGLALCGAGYALVNPATARGVLAWFDRRYRATAMGIKQTGVPLGAVAIAMVAALTTESWRWVAIALAVVMVVSAALFAPLKAETAGANTTTLFRGLRAAIAHRNLVYINCGAFLYNIAYGSVLTYLVSFAYEEVKVSAAKASLLLAVIQASSAVARVLWGVIGDALPGNGRATGLLVCGTLGAAGVVSLATASSLLHLNVAAVALGLTLGGFASLAQTYAVEAVDPALAGAAVGFNALLVTSGQMVGPALFALCLQAGGYGMGFAVITVGLIAGAGLFVASARRAPAAVR